MATHVQNTTVFSQSRNSVSGCGEVSDDHLPLSLDCGPTVTGCGHVMHARCYQKLMDTKIKQEMRNRATTGFRPFSNYDVNENEFLCPICDRLSNSVLPLLQAVPAHVPLAKAGSQSFYAWAERMKKFASNKVSSFLIN